MKAQTPIKWLQETLECFGNKHELQMSWDTLHDLLEQANAMFEEQVKDAYKFGLSDEYVIGSERYYNETFKSEQNEKHTLNTNRQTK
jgi:hypothetical protein